MDISIRCSRKDHGLSETNLVSWFSNTAFAATPFFVQRGNSRTHERCCIAFFARFRVNKLTWKQANEPGSFFRVTTMKFALMAVVGVLATGCAMGGPTQDRAYKKKTTRDPQVISVLTGPSSLVQDDTTVVLL